MEFLLGSRVAHLTKCLGFLNCGDAMPPRKSIKLQLLASNLQGARMETEIEVSVEPKREERLECFSVWRKNRHSFLVLTCSCMRKQI